MKPLNFILKELVHIRCLLEGIYLDSREAKDHNLLDKNKGCTLDNVSDRCTDEYNEYMEQLK